jgi:VanZ family protein
VAFATKPTTKPKTLPLPSTRTDRGPVAEVAPGDRSLVQEDAEVTEPASRLRADGSGRPIQRLLFSSGARRAWTVALAMLVAFTLTKALSPHSEPVITSGWDKADHLAAFAALACVGVIALHGVVRGSWWLAAGLLALGGLIEVVQLYMPGRSSDWQDLAADALGIAAGLLIGAAVTARFDRRRQPRGAAMEHDRPQV